MVQHTSCLFAGLPLPRLLLSWALLHSEAAFWMLFLGSPFSGLNRDSGSWRNQLRTRSTMSKFAGVYWLPGCKQAKSSARCPKETSCPWSPTCRTFSLARPVRPRHLYLSFGYEGDTSFQKQFHWLTYFFEPSGAMLEIDAKRLLAAFGTLPSCKQNSLHGGLGRNSQ